MVTTMQLVHEAETQRMHPRLRIPLEVEIEGRVYAARDLSVGGVGLAEGVSPLRRNQRASVRLRMPFEDFDMSMPLLAEVRHEGSEERGTGLQFTDLTPRQVNFLHHAVNGYLSGQIVKAGDIFDVAARDYGTAPRASKADLEPRSRFRGASRIFGLTIFALVGLLCVGFIGAAIAERTFVTEATGTLSSRHAVVVRSPMAGILRNVLVNPGQELQRETVVAVVESADGVTAPVRSPCDCILATAYAAEGEYLNLNQAMLGLTPDSAAQVVLAQVPLEAARDIQRGDKVFVDFFGSGGSISGQVENVVAASIDPNSYAGRSFNTPPLARIEVALSEQLPVEMIGRPANVRISALDRVFSNLAAGLGRLRNEN